MSGSWIKRDSHLFIQNFQSYYRPGTVLGSAFVSLNENTDIKQIITNNQDEYFGRKRSMGNKNSFSLREQKLLMQTVQ